MRRLILPVVAAAALSACLPGGRDLPPTLATLTPSTPAPATIDRLGDPENAVTVEMPIVPQALQADRIPVHVGPTAIAYVTDAIWIDRPAPLFRQLVSETISRRTRRVVLEPAQGVAQAGLRVTGTLHHFGYHADTREAVVVYDAAIRRNGVVESRRFEARGPADGTAATVPAALNAAANEVAVEVADWIGG